MRLRSISLLQSGEDGGDALHLVEDCTLRKPSNKTSRISVSSSPGDIVIEVDVVVSNGVADHPGEGGLATLARAVYENGGRVGQRFHQRTFGVAWIERCGLHRPIVNLRCV